MSKQDDTTTQEPKKGEGDDKTFTQAELDSIIGKKLAAERAKQDQAIKEAKEAAVTEANRLAKLSADEKADEERKKREAELDAKAKDITRRELEIEAGSQLAEKELPRDFTSFVIGDDAETTSKNIAKLSEVFSKAVEAGVTAKLKGESPKDTGGDKGDDDNDSKPAVTGTVAF